MTDNTTWQPPAPPPPAPAQPFAPPSPPLGYAPAGPPGQWQGQTQGQAQWQGQPQQPGQGAGWTPPPKPGLIPLRPLGFGTLLGASFQVVRRNPRPTFGISLLLNGGVSLLFVAVIGGLAVFAFGRLNTANASDVDDVTAGAVGALLLASLIPLTLSVLVTAILQGIVSLEVSRGTIGEKLTVRGLWRLARGRIGALVGWSALVSGVTLVVVVAVSLVIVLVVSVGNDVAVGVAILFGVVAFLVALGLSFWLMTKLALIPSILMLERLTLGRAVARSWSLTRGYFWKTLGTQLLVSVIVQTAAQVVTVPVSFVFAFGGLLVNPNSDEAFAIGAIVLSYVVTGIISLVFSALATVTTSAVYALVYIDIRMRKEALDIDLTRFVEARQTGQAGVGNPYLTGKPASAPAATPWA